MLTRVLMRGTVIRHVDKECDCLHTEDEDLLGR